MLEAGAKNMPSSVGILFFEARWNMSLKEEIDWWMMIDFVDFRHEKNTDSTWEVVIYFLQEMIYGRKMVDFVIIELNPRVNTCKRWGFDLQKSGKQSCKLFPLKVMFY